MRTRPLGASFADWFGKPAVHGAGYGYGDVTVAAEARVAIVALVLSVAVRRNDVPPPLDGGGCVTATPPVLSAGLTRGSAAG